MKRGKFSLSVLQTADRAHVVASLAAFAHKPASGWLAPGSPGAGGNLPKRWDRVKAMPADEIVRALAAAGPNHCIDAWSFLARALSALLAGDQHAARHFAYYMQLRAALSILASVGVGIFNKTNFVVTATGAIDRLDPGASAHAEGIGTHEIVWTALKEWSNDPSLAKQFLTLMRLQGSPIAECLDAIWPGYSPEAVAGKLVRIWTLDLARASNEQRARNQSSYAPQALMQIPVTTKDYLKLVAHIWDMCEPTAPGSFNQLDRHLLRESLWANQGIAEPSLSRLDGAMSSRLDYLPSQVKFIADDNFLLGKSEPSLPDIITYARQTSLPSSALAMIARGVLLTRVATGFTCANFTDAGIDLSGGALRPWLDPIGVDRGYWNPAAPQAEFANLWTEVEEALEHLAEATKTQPLCRFDWSSQSPNGLSTISEAERIGLWSLSA
ncbi:MAG: hypothetical protein WAU68_15105 [Vitreimonas sp.]